jgi:hypothetical protein
VPSSDFANPNLYRDATGKGAFLGTLQGAEQVSPAAAQANQATLRPQGGAAAKTVKKATGEKAEKEESSEEKVEESTTLDVSDFAAALFEGEELSESFKQKCIAIFEAAVNEKVAVMEQAMLEASKKLIEEQVVASVDTITEGVDKYLTYVCEEWVKENELAIEQGMKTEIVENFIYGLKDLFENSFIDVPDEKYNVVDDLFEANSDLEAKLNAQINENLELKNTIIAHKCAEAFVEAANGLADTEVEKFASLAEGIEFDSVEQYKEKIKLLRESYFNGEVSHSSTSTSTLSESVSQSKQITEDGTEMDFYVRAISEQLKLTNTKPVSQK